MRTERDQISVPLPGDLDDPPVRAPLGDVGVDSHRWRVTARPERFQPPASGGFSRRPDGFDIERGNDLPLVQLGRHVERVNQGDFSIRPGREVDGVTECPQGGRREIDRTDDMSEAPVTRFREGETILTTLSVHATPVPGARQRRP